VLPTTILMHLRGSSSMHRGKSRFEVVLQHDRSCVSVTRKKAVVAVLYQNRLCCAVLCCAVLCCAVLCCAVLCCAVLCCAVLCCAVLARAALPSNKYCSSLWELPVAGCCTVSCPVLVDPLCLHAAQKLTPRKGAVLSDPVMSPI
jgi:hypothetical protein